MAKLFFVLAFCMAGAVGAVDSAWAESAAPAQAQDDAPVITAPPPTLENAPVVPATQSPKQDGATATPDYSTMPQDAATQRQLQALARDGISEVEAEHVDRTINLVLLFSTIVLIFLTILLVALGVGTIWVGLYVRKYVREEQIRIEKDKAPN